MSATPIPLRLHRPPRARGPPLRRRQGQFRRRHRPARDAARRAGDLPASGRAHRGNRQARRAHDARRALRARRRASLPPATDAADGRSRYAERAAPAAGLRRRALFRRMGRGRGRRHARAWPRTPPKRSRSTTSRCRSCSTPRRRYATRQPAGARGARLQRAARQHLRLGRGREGFRRQPAHAVAAGEMGPQLDGADRDLRRGDAAGTRGARFSTSGPRSRCRTIPTRSRSRSKLPGSSVRVHNDVDVGGSYGVKRGIKHTVLVGYLARRLGVPVRLIEDRLENMRGGDAHGPERIFDVEVAFDDDGVIRSMKMRALDNVGAYAGRSPFQLGKPIGAIVGPYQHQERAVPARSRSSPTRRRRRRCAASARRRPISRIERAIDEVAPASRPRSAGGAPAQPDPRTRSFPI